MKTDSYRNLRDKLNTGDIILFSGGGRFSAMIKLATRSKWSHVGMIVRADELDAICVWESADKGVNISNLDGLVMGGQMSFLSRIVNRTAGDVAIRLLQAPRTPEMLERFRAFRKEAMNRPYEKNILELVRAAFEDMVLVGNREADLSSFFCSELIAETYQQMGLLRGGRPSNTYSPKDFSDTGYLDLADGVALSEEILLTERVD